MRLLTGVFFLLCLEAYEITVSDPQTTLGRAAPIALGATIAAFITVLNNWLTERRKVRDAIKILYQELLFLTFRCAWDFRQPWKNFWNEIDADFTRDRVQKFRPDRSTVFDSLGRDLALIPPKPLARVLRFHQCLELWRQSLDYYLFHEPSRLADKKVREHLVKRLGDSLQLGWSALSMLRCIVNGADNIDKEFRASLQPTLEHAEVKDPDFIKGMANEAERLVKKPLF